MAVTNVAEVEVVAVAGAVFLYDVTSVYFEGRHNELADFGYNRDGKKGKKQMVAGLLTGGQGEPLSIQLYRGNTNDPPTFLDALVSLLALKLARELDRRMAPLGLTVEDAIERLKGVRLVRLGEPGLRWWRLVERYPAAQTEVLEALPKLPSPVLSLGKPNLRRLRNPRKGRSDQ